MTYREQYNVPENFWGVIVEFDGAASGEAIAYVKYPSDGRALLAHMRDTLSFTHFELYNADKEAEL